MSVIRSLKNLVPFRVKRALAPLTRRFQKKYDAELKFWQARYREDGNTFSNAHYERIMLGMSEQNDSAFLDGKIVADFGCGPRGSLAWIKNASMKIGIDILVDMYVDNFSSLPTKHGMAYLKSTENVIPLPDGFVDIMYSVNAIDHVDNFEAMCDEIIRVVKPGGELIFSFNLEEAATVCEPQRLSEELIERTLLSKLETLSYRVTSKGPKGNQYKPFFGDDPLSYKPGTEGYLWIRASKPA